MCLKGCSINLKCWSDMCPISRFNCLWVYSLRIRCYSVCTHLSCPSSSEFCVSWLWSTIPIDLKSSTILNQGKGNSWIELKYELLHFLNWLRLYPHFKCSRLCRKLSLVYGYWRPDIESIGCYGCKFDVFWFDWILF